MGDPLYVCFIHSIFYLLRAIYIYRFQYVAFLRSAFIAGSLVYVVGALM